MNYFQKWALKNKEKIKKYHQKYYQENKDEYKKRETIYRKSNSYIIWRRKWRAIYDKKWRLEHREKTLIYKRLQHLVHIKVIKRLPCQICGELKTHFHHIDYNRPAEVYHLCKDCHIKAHLQPNILENLTVSNYNLQFLPQKRGRKSIN